MISRKLHLFLALQLLMVILFSVGNVRAFSSPRTALTVRNPQTFQMAASSNVLATTLETIQSFSRSAVTTEAATSIFDTVTSKALSTPPVAYFLALMAAGCGIPVSEDALCIFAGAAWTALPRERQVGVLVALYAGVVFSDFLTFWIGRALRLGVFEPVVQWLKLSDEAAEEQESESRWGKIKRRIETSGDWIGFVIRFSVGTRGPLMLLTGFTNKIPFLKFMLGASLGGLFTLPLQLYTGYALGHRNPEAVVALIVGISAFVCTAAAALATASWGTLLMVQLKKMRAQGQAT